MCVGFGFLFSVLVWTLSNICHLAYILNQDIRHMFAEMLSHVLLYQKSCKTNGNCLAGMLKSTCAAAQTSSCIRAYAAAAGILGQKRWRRPSSQMTVHLFVQIPAQRYAWITCRHDSNVNTQLFLYAQMFIFVRFSM